MHSSNHTSGQGAFSRACKSSKALLCGSKQPRNKEWDKLPSLGPPVGFHLYQICRGIFGAAAFMCMCQPKDPLQAVGIMVVLITMFPNPFLLQTTSDCPLPLLLRSVPQGCLGLMPPSTFQSLNIPSEATSIPAPPPVRLACNVLRLSQRGGLNLPTET